ncbi:hypothetical protein BGX24_006464, partial [Mortierella sp. AD032]
MRNPASGSICWGKDEVLDLILWKTKASHRLAILIAPQDGQYSARRDSISPETGRISVPAPISQEQHYTSRIARLVHLIGPSSRLVVPCYQQHQLSSLPRIGNLFSLETDEQE